MKDAASEPLGARGRPDYPGDHQPAVHFKAGRLRNGAGARTGIPDQTTSYNVRTAKAARVEEHRGGLREQRGFKVSRLGSKAPIERRDQQGK